jgi:hypothetical protein
MGRRLTFCAISALKENLHDAPFPFLMRLWRNGAAQSDLWIFLLTSKFTNN